MLLTLSQAQCTNVWSKQRSSAVDGCNVILRACCTNKHFGFWNWNGYIRFIVKEIFWN